MSENLEDFLTKEELQTITCRVDAVTDLLSAINALPDAQLSRRIEGLVTIAPQDLSQGAIEPESFSPQILKPIGQGAMGEVFLARDPGLQRRVALKQLKKREETPGRVAARFVSEAQITAQLDHPNIVPVYGLTNLEGKTIAYTMKLVKGSELSKVIGEARELEEKKASLPEALSLQSRLEHFLKVCDAVHFAHVKGVIHRDLKPANIMLGEFHEVYVMDWGLAALIGTGAETQDGGDDEDAEFITASPERSVAGSVAGTLLYMSPEQARGENLTLDARSDQYTLGLILAELVYLQPARRGKSAIELLTKTAMGEPLSLKHITGRKVPPELEAIIFKACAFERDKRYASVAALADDVRRFLRGNAVLAKKDSYFAKVLRWIGQHRLETLLLCFGLSSAVCLSVVWDLYHHNKLLERAELQQELSSKLVAVVASRASDIEARFLSVEKRLETIMIGAETLIGFGSPREYSPLTLDMALSATPPADLRPSTLYGMPVSIDRPVTFITAGAEAEKVKQQLALLSPMDSYFRRTLIRSAKKRSTDPDSTEHWELIATKGTPIRWSMVGLESGGALIYPGNAALKADYDPRQRPWYVLAKNTIGKHWGSPYWDLFGQGLLLPCASAIYSPAGEFLGVASVDLTFQDVVDEFMHLPDLRGFQEAFLVNEDGQILVRSTLPNKLKETRAGALELENFPYKNVLDAMRSSPIGYMRHSQRGKRFWSAYAHIGAIGMYYVATVDAERMLEDL